MRITAAIVGAIAGFLAAAAQAFFHVIPPPAYGICIACHMRDLVNWVTTHIYPIYGLKAGGALMIPGAPVSYMFLLLTGAFSPSIYNHRHLLSCLCPP